MIMRDIASLYMDKVNRIYDNASELQRLTNDKNVFPYFCKYIVGKNEVINQFKNISGDICQIIDNGDFDKDKISLKFDQIVAVSNLANQLKTTICKSKHFFINHHNHQAEVANFEKLITDCFYEMTFSTIDNYKIKLADANKRLIELIRKCIAKNQCYISSGGGYILGLKAYGTVLAVGENYKGQCNTESWRNIVAICAASSHTVGLKANGKVLAVGWNHNGQCNTESWRDVQAICASIAHTVGLKADGTVVGAGEEEYYKTATNWTNIVAICTGQIHTVGLKANGTVLATGGNNRGQCNTENWRDIIAICAGCTHTVGLKSDGTVCSVGHNEYGQCNTDSWRDIIAICAGFSHTVGLKADGTVVAVGDNRDGQCNTGEWKDIVEIYASIGGGFTLGLKIDGTVVAVGDNRDGRYNTGEWRDIVAVCSGSVGLKANGTIVLTTGYDEDIKRAIRGWKGIGPLDVEHVKKEDGRDSKTKEFLKKEQNRMKEERNRRKEEQRQEQERLKKEEQRLLEQSNSWQAEGLSRCCGVEFKGLFTKKCTRCGKVKDY